MVSAGATFAQLARMSSVLERSALNGQSQGVHGGDGCPSQRRCLVDLDAQLIDSAEIQLGTYSTGNLGDDVRRELDHCEGIRGDLDIGHLKSPQSPLRETAPLSRRSPRS